MMNIYIYICIYAYRGNDTILLYYIRLYYCIPNIYIYIFLYSEFLGDYELRQSENYDLELELC